MDCNQLKTALRVDIGHTPAAGTMSAMRAAHLWLSMGASLLCAALSVHASSLTRVSSFEYDATTGLLSAEVVEPDTAQLCVRTVYGYDIYGNKNLATTSNCTGATGLAVFTTRASGATFNAVSTTVNGTPVTVPAGYFPATSTNALNQSETKVYDPRFGTVTQLTGPNALATQWQFDDFGRKVLETRADGTRTTVSYCYVGGLDTGGTNSADCGTLSTLMTAPTEAVIFVHTVPQNTSGVKNGPYGRTYHDRLGREIRSVTQSYDGNGQSVRLIAKDTRYDEFGAVALATQPYFMDTNSSLASGSAAYGRSTSTYDLLGRPTESFVSDPQGQGGNKLFADGTTLVVAHTTYLYVGLTTTVTNDRGQRQKTEKNAQGQLARVTDATDAQLAHRYDAFGNLVETRDALDNRVVIDYDVRGRKKAITDPDTGNWKYDYDALGQMVWQQSPNQRAAVPPQQTTLAYDKLGRLTSRSEPEYVSTWTYDQYADGSACNKGKGKLCEVNTTNGTKRKLTYDNLGRPQVTQLAITSGPTFTSSVAYDSANGRPIQQTYPTGLKVDYSYTNLGYQEKLSNTAGGGMLWQAQTINAWGKVETQLYGNMVQTRALFDAQTGRTNEIDAGASNSVLQQTYTYDSLSNLTTRTETAPGPATGAGLAGSVSASTAAVNLATVGTVDWAHWPNYDHKATGGSKITTYTKIGSQTVTAYTNDLRTVSWSGGTPTASGSNMSGVYIPGVGMGFSISAPADTTARTLTVYVGGWVSGGRLTAHLSDGSAADYVDTSLSGSGQYDGTYTLTYQAASAGQLLTVTWVQISGTGNVTLQGAALANASAPPPSGSVVVTETFNYESVNRLSKYTVQSTAIANSVRQVELQYNALGNLLYKTDVGVYSYTASGLNMPRPHAVNAVSANTYTYDPNGNLITVSGGKYRSIAYTSFNLPDSQTESGG